MQRLQGLVNGQIDLIQNLSQYYENFNFNFRFLYNMLIILLL